MCNLDTVLDRRTGDISDNGYIFIRQIRKLLIDKDMNVLPMVPAGKPIETVFDQDDLDK